MTPVNGRRRIIVAWLSLHLACFGPLAAADSVPLPVHPVPDQAVDAAPDAADELQEKMVWGLLLKLVAPTVFEVVGKWLAKKLSPRIDALLQGDASTSARVVAAPAAGVSAGAAAVANTRFGSPPVPMFDASGHENYQAVHVALVAVDARGQPAGLRNLEEGFATGERFKVRVLSTFDAYLTVDNITPAGLQRRLYPAREGHVLRLEAGKEALFPVEANAFFQFAGALGEDRLRLSIHHPDALRPGLAAQTPVFRKDEPYGSNFVQEVPDGRYPALIESLRVRHR